MGTPPPRQRRTPGAILSYRPRQRDTWRYPKGPADATLYWFVQDKGGQIFPVFATDRPTYGATPSGFRFPIEMDAESYAMQVIHVHPQLLTDFKAAVTRQQTGAAQ